MNQSPKEPSLDGEYALKTKNLTRQQGRITFFCFLDGYSGYHHISIHPDDQSKATFTCPYGTYAYRRMSFRLCNAPASFQRCMMSILSNILKKSWKFSWMTFLFIEKLLVIVLKI
jgi:hypothetical protein